MKFHKSTLKSILNHEQLAAVKCKQTRVTDKNVRQLIQKYFADICRTKNKERKKQTKSKQQQQQQKHKHKQTQQNNYKNKSQIF